MKPTASRMMYDDPTIQEKVYKKSTSPLRVRLPDGLSDTQRKRNKEERQELRLQRVMTSSEKLYQGKSTTDSINPVVDMKTSRAALPPKPKHNLKLNKQSFHRPCQSESTVAPGYNTSLCSYKDSRICKEDEIGDEQVADTGQLLYAQKYI